jgi:hypothetical protein
MPASEGGRYKCFGSGAVWLDLRDRIVKKVLVSKVA